MIEIPESVAFYWGDRINRAAIDVLAKSAEVPPDLSWAEIERLELAGLAAHRIRVEYWTLLRALWSACWGEAVRAHLPAARLLGYGEHREFKDEVDTLADPSVDGAWAQRALCGVFDVPGRGRLFTRVALVEDEREGALSFYFWDDEDGAALSDGLSLGAEWDDDGEDRRITRAGLLPRVGEGARIDVAPFAARARDAMTALAVAL